MADPEGNTGVRVDAPSDSPNVVRVALRTVDGHKTAGLDELTDGVEISSDDPDPANGSGVHRYVAWVDGRKVAEVQFQHGPRDEEDSVPGLTSQAFIAILIDHFESFQVGAFKNRSNALVITALEEARNRMVERVIDRKKRGVLGQYKV